MKRVFLIILDSFGIGSCMDSYEFGDYGANTFGNIAKMCFLGKANNGRSGVLSIPNLMSLGIGEIFKEVTGNYPLGVKKTKFLQGCYAYSSSISKGKDTFSGHWEIVGVPIFKEWFFFNKLTNSFSKSLLNKIKNDCGLTGILGNCHASGTEIIKKFGIEHLLTKKPIFYTSSDSVFQVSCHEKEYGLNNLYELCKKIRIILNKNKINIARVIARPFIGNNPENFKRTEKRKDFSIIINKKTVLEKLILEKGGSVHAIGKISDIFSGIGITSSISTQDLFDSFEKTIKAINCCSRNSIVFSNFIDFDSLWGHRRDVSGYAKGLEYFDFNLPRLLNILKKDDLLIITADHGCDPTWIGTDHTREYVPILIYKKKMKNKFLGCRKTFADISQTISEYFGISRMNYGDSIL
ncbi:Phosphopentomutase [Buchnera aphidicola (Tetraneura ulmi)]|uniref:phosphopentomutase n=1 Tax=Buchnera aphidicola TaxID=9 RepID=UPI003464E249